MVHNQHRLRGYQYLSGTGLEIGAFNLPAPLPKSCRVEYCDVLTRKQARQLFPEINTSTLVDVQYICDLDTQGLAIFKDNQFDFVVCNHVIEHIANPIRLVAELFRVLKRNGKIVISAPDKHYTFDKERTLTPYSHLLKEYEEGITEVTDEHYLDFLRGVFPGTLNDPLQKQQALDHVRKRREHAHVWTSESFRFFLQTTICILKVPATCIFESLSYDNQEEYFGVWSKLDDHSLSSKFYQPKHSQCPLWYPLMRAREVLKQQGVDGFATELRSYIRWHLTCNKK